MQSVQKVLRNAQTCIKQLLESLCHRAASSPPSRTSETHGDGLTMEICESISDQTDVSLLMMKHLVSTKAKDANLVFSPVSIHVVLGLITAGSKGRTLDQLLRFLKSKTIEEINSLYSQLITLVFADGAPLGGPRLSFANGVWVDKSLRLKPTFREIVDSAYRASAGHVDFQRNAVEAMEEVNLWAETETGGLIKELLSSGSVNASTRLIFANALYFKGAWNEKFDASETKEDTFFLQDGSSVQVPFMTSKKKQYVRAFKGFKVLGLPYKQGEDTRKFSMYIFLPDNKDGLPALVKKFGAKTGFLEKHLPYEQVRVGEFRIPKFRISFGFEASEDLKKLGVVLPFSGGGLTEMVEFPLGQNLCVSSIFHKSFIEVNEEGTEAAAATAGVVMLRSFTIEDELDFVADHPFLFVVREDTTGLLLFIGQIHNPLSG